MTITLGEVGTIAKFSKEREWSLQGRLIESRKGHSAMMVSNEKYLVVGGEGSK